MIKLFPVFFFLLAAVPAYADSMRCGSRLVSTGEIKPIVLLRCGEPFYKEEIGREIVTNTVTREVHPGKYRGTDGVTRSNTHSHGGVSGEVTVNTEHVKGGIRITENSPYRDSNRTITTRGKGNIRVTETVRSGTKEIYVEKWYYNLGKNRFFRILTFKGDKLFSIELGDKP